MKKVNMILLAAAFCCVFIVACKSDRTKDLELNGMFTQADSGTVAVGSIEIQAAPTAAESVSLKMWWTSPFLAPSEVRPCARLIVSGSNTSEKADKMVDAIAKAIGINFFTGLTNVTEIIHANAK